MVSFIFFLKEQLTGALAIAISLASFNFLSPLIFFSFGGSVL